MDWSINDLSRHWAYRLHGYTTRLTARPLTLLCGAKNISKIWSACGQHGSQYTEHKPTHNYKYV